jgi:hypothetical protein
VTLGAAGIGTTSSATTPHGTASVGGTAGSVVAANPNRVRLILGNDHASQVIYLSLGGTAELNKGIRLNAVGGQINLEGYTGAVSAIATGSTTPLLITEL